MTSEQKAWLDAHRFEGYRPMGTGSATGSGTAGGTHWKKRGMLHPDGTFEPWLGHARPSVRPGSFEVGIFEHTPAGQMRGP